MSRFRFFSFADKTHRRDEDGTAMVSSGSAGRSVSRIAGPTLLNREPASGRGLASAGRAPTCVRRSKDVDTVVRSSRFSLFVALVAVCALAAAGCGGAAETPPADPNAGMAGSPAPGTTGDLAATDPAAAGAPGAVPPSAGKDPQPVQQGDAVSTSDATPKDFVKALGRRPIVVFMYQPRSDVDELFRTEVRAAVKAVPGVKYFEYRLQDYEQYRDLPERVGAMDAPAVSIIARNSRIQNYFSAFTDRHLLTVAIQTAASAPAAPVTTPEVKGQEPDAGAPADADAAAAEVPSSLSDLAANPSGGGI